jgi:hypothetical protein
MCIDEAVAIWGVGWRDSVGGDEDETIEQISNFGETECV